MIARSFGYNLRSEIGSETEKGDERGQFGSVVEEGSWIFLESTKKRRSILLQQYRNKPKPIEDLKYSTADEDLNQRKNRTRHSPEKKRSAHLICFDLEQEECAEFTRTPFVVLLGSKRSSMIIASIV